jgi:hypothetical protein
MTIRARLNSSRFRRWPLLQNRVMDFNGLARKPLCYRQLSLGAAPSRQLRRSAIRTRFLLAHIGDPFSNQATTLESQMIHMIQELFGQTLSPTCAESRVGFRQINGLAEKSSLHF